MTFAQSTELVVLIAKLAALLKQEYAPRSVRRFKAASRKCWSISQSEFDQTQEAFELAKSGLLRAEANLLEAEQQVTLNRETLKFQEARLADAKLLAPFDGLVIERERDAGAIVVSGSPILQLISLDELCAKRHVFV